MASLLQKVPLVAFVFISSLLAIPLSYTLDKLLVMEEPSWVFAAAGTSLLVFVLISYTFVYAGGSPCRKEPLFYAWSLFAFTAVAGLLIGLELDGYIKGFMDFYLRKGEPYMIGAYGTAVNWWDGIGHYSMYMIMIALAASG